MSLLDLSDLGVARQGRGVLGAVSLRVERGECVGLIGANGAGKTTLMRAALGLIGHSGTSSLAALAPAARARHVAWLPQAREIAWPVPVETLVLLGRIPHAGAARDADRRAVDGALSRMGLQEFRHRPATQLSGGEQARVLIARALAQETPLVMADEPIAGLDPAHQLTTMQIFADMARAGHGLMVSLHDLGLAARYCTRLVLLSGGGIAADGAPRDVLSPDNLRAHFGIRAHFEQTPDGPVFQPLGTVP